MVSNVKGGVSHVISPLGVGVSVSRHFSPPARGPVITKSLSSCAVIATLKSHTNYLVSSYSTIENGLV